jgi:DNA-binding CsgD family transcriptional regulator
MYRVFLDYIRQLATAEDVTDLQNALKVIAERYELPTFAYLLMPGTVKATAKLISTYPSRWTNHYLERGYERTDPIILRSGKDIRPFDWSADLAENAEESIRCFFSEAADFGIRYGFTIPLHDEFGFAAITFASDRWNPALSDMVWQNIHLLQFAAILFHTFARRRLGPPFLINGAHLTPREYECLHLVAQGKSAWDISRILHISQHCAEFHLGNVRAKLDVHSICQAIYYLGGLR